MIVIWFVCSALIGVGTFYFIAYAMKYPLLASGKTIAALGKKNIKNVGSIALLKENLSKRLEGLIRISSYRSERMKAELASAGILATPESYLANAVISGVLILAAVPVAIMIFPPMAIGVVLLATAVFFKEYRTAFDINEKKKKEIESELLRFTATMKEGLKTSRDILSMLEDYRNTSHKTLSKELAITITDMRTGNYEAGLSRFAARVNSSLVNDVVRGLLGTLRGDDQTRYFETIVEKMKGLEIQQIRKDVLKRPSKLKAYSFLMVLCFTITYLVVMGVEMVRSFGKLF